MPLSGRQHISLNSGPSGLLVLNNTLRPCSAAAGENVPGIVDTGLNPPRF